MSNLLRQPQTSDIANVCAEHTHRVQLLAGQFWKGDIDLWHYRRQSRELTQQFVDKVTALLHRTIG